MGQCDKFRATGLAARFAMTIRPLEIRIIVASPSYAYLAVNDPDGGVLEATLDANELADLIRQATDVLAKMEVRRGSDD